MSAALNQAEFNHQLKEKPGIKFLQVRVTWQGRRGDDGSQQGELEQASEVLGAWSSSRKEERCFPEDKSLGMNEFLSTAGP